MLRSVYALSALSLFLSCAAQAKNIEIILPVQSDFEIVAEDLVATIAYKALAPAEASGITGFEIAAEATYVPVDDKDAWKRLTGLSVDQVGLVGLRAFKGLPFNIDIGAFYSGLPEYDVKVYGGEIRYAFLPGSTLLPAVALRGAYSRTAGIDDFDLDATSLDLSISKGFAFITPYVGAGYVWGVADPQGVPGLEKVDVEKAKVYVGARMSLGLLHLTPEYERIGDVSVYNLNFGLHF
jgi:hypothetical protein